jgi:ParB family chromosome partitioning protein
LRLLQLPEDVLNDVSRGTLSAGHARALLAITELDEQRRLWQRIRAEKLSVRDVERAARRPTASGPGSARPREAVANSSDPHVRSIEDRLRQVFGTQVRIVQRGAGGKVEIEFYSREELERVLGLLGVLDPA